MPRERVLTESDGPFAQLKGRSIFPWEVDVAVDALAKCWESDSGLVGQILRDNLRILLDSASTKGETRV
jgi:TatD DNase family protein